MWAGGGGGCGRCGCVGCGGVVVCGVRACGDSIGWLLRIRMWNEPLKKTSEDLGDPNKAVKSRYGQVAFYFFILLHETG